VFIACLIPTYAGPSGKPAREMDDAQGYAEIIMPTVDGCLNIMRSAVDAGIRNIVICSSTSSTNPNPPVAIKTAGRDQERSRPLVGREAAMSGEKIYLGCQDGHGKSGDPVRRRKWGSPVHHHANRFIRPRHSSGTPETQSVCLVAARDTGWGSTAQQGAKRFGLHDPPARPGGTVSGGIRKSFGFGPLLRRCR
jgi:hypothetical protein